MQIDNKMRILLVVVLSAAMVIAVAYYFNSIKKPLEEPKEAVQAQDLKVDDLLTESEDESAITSQEDSDANLINADDNEINDLGNSAQENEF